VKIESGLFEKQVAILEQPPNLPLGIVEDILKLFDLREGKE